GFAAMAYEVAWTRVLVLLIGSSTYAFALMLATFLSGLALGSYLISRVADRLRSPLAVFGLLEIGIGLTAFWGMFQFEKLPLLYLSLFKALSANPALLILGKFLLSGLIIFPPTLLMGAAFPVIVRICNEKSHTVGLSVGRTYGVNTIGAIGGSFAAGFLMIPFLGIQASLTLLVILNLALGLILLFWSRERVMVLSGVGAAVILGFISVASPPSWNRLVMSSGVYQTAPVLLRVYPTPGETIRLFRGYEEIFYREGWNSTVTVFRKPNLAKRPHIALAIDGKIDASTSRDMSTQVLSAHLPLMVAEHERNVLVVGYASGVTVGSVLLYPVEQVVVAEIEPAVIEASRYFDSVNHQPLEDPRVRLVLDDARHYLGLTDKRFDVVISEPSNPWLSGPSRLFTREFFKLGKEHLTPNGIFAQWIQMYGMKPELLKALVRTFHAVFSDVLIFRVSQADLLLLGAERPLLMDYRRITQLMGLAGIRDDLRRVGVRDPLDLLLKFRLGTKEIEDYVGTGPLNTDNNGLIEFKAPKTIYVDSIEENVEDVERASRGMTAYVQGIGDTPLDEARFYLKLARWSLEGGGDHQAEALAQKSLSLSGGAEAHWLLGRIQARRGYDLTARQHWNQALKLDPTHEGTLLSLARYDQDHARFQEGARYLATAVELYPGNPWPRFYNGVNLFYLGSYDKASRELEAFLKISPHKEKPHRILACYYLVQAYERGDKPRRAAAQRVLLVQQLRKLRSRLEWDEGGEELDRLLILVRRHGEQAAFHRTEQDLRVLVTQYVTDPLAHYLRGVSLYFLGYSEKAAQELKTVLKVLPLGDDSARTRYYLKLIAAGRQVPEEKQLFTPIRKERKYDEQATAET
ncbi:MAG: fused MFS/spermidine synthase, partial [Candidatus Binatia bacterium]